jgi:hypothetical protein
MATWYDLKLAVLQKMFSADDKVIADESTIGYLSAMPHCANEGLALLATAGKFITKSVKIAQMGIVNLLSDTISDEIHEFSDTYSYQADEGQSYYFECVGVGSCAIYVDDTVLRTITLNSKSYEVYKGLINNPDKKTVKFEFTTSYPMAIKNVAIYKENFATAEEVTPWTDKVKYDMKELAPDFYMIDTQGIYYEGEYQTYLQTSDFYQEGTHTLVLDRDMVGSFTIYYRAYPVELTKGTEDTYELPIDPEVYSLLPLYMASQLYKDDDNGIATSYRNEFEVGFERLINSANLSAYEEWTSESGWV